MRIDIFMACPMCLSQGYSCTKEFWRHELDGGVLTIDENANIKCKTCGKGDHLLNVQLSCHSGRHKYSVPNREYWASAISTSGQFVNNGGLAWLQRIMQKI
jgi:hypothetical protein